MKFKKYKKGFVSFGFNSPSDSYKHIVGFAHNGIDYVKGYGATHTFDNAGFIYKVYRPQEREDNWTGVYQLVPYTANGADYMEVCMGHFMFIPPFVKEGVWAEEDSMAGFEGNYGLVFSNGVQITPEMQDAGDKRGSHVHELYRPVKKVEGVTTGKHYLRKGDGSYYHDTDGLLLEIIETNDVQGCIDPLGFAINNKQADDLLKLAKTLTGVNKSAVEAVAQIVNVWG